MSFATATIDPTFYRVGLIFYIALAAQEKKWPEESLPGSLDIHSTDDANQNLQRKPPMKTPCSPIPTSRKPRTCWLPASIPRSDAWKLNSTWSS